MKTPSAKAIALALYMSAIVCGGWVQQFLVSFSKSLPEHQQARVAMSLRRPGRQKSWKWRRAVAVSVSNRLWLADGTAALSEIVVAATVLPSPHATGANTATAVISIAVIDPTARPCVVNAVCLATFSPFLQSDS
ncbi:hypothetical protein [Mycobacteroides abscessus]|uniref:hypothetical protein n=1 Tax=Mycobacteroides abscessus TaxID=36809 RepID=UPI0009D5D08F|nr:hypothetical protein [Mycobacteroides abscessus]SKT62877.1 Uncharacterised protein [Mycobacteroides abscessus subsp. massiliense]SKU17697.1 Uncharacterised protein [Mycobacteroides abscessus subsp. massiliense]